MSSSGVSDSSPGLSYPLGSSITSSTNTDGTLDYSLISPITDLRVQNMPAIKIPLLRLKVDGTQTSSTMKFFPNQIKDYNNENIIKKGTINGIYDTVTSKLLEKNKEQCKQNLNLFEIQDTISKANNVACLESILHERIIKILYMIIDFLLDPENIKITNPTSYNNFKRQIVLLIKKLNENNILKEKNIEPIHYSYNVVLEIIEALLIDHLLEDELPEIQSIIDKFSTLNQFLLQNLQNSIPLPLVSSLFLDYEAKSTQNDSDKLTADLTNSKKSQLRWKRLFETVQSKLSAQTQAIKRDPTHLNDNFTNANEEHEDILSQSGDSNPPQENARDQTELDKLKHQLTLLELELTGSKLNESKLQTMLDDMKDKENKICNNINCNDNDAIDGSFRSNIKQTIVDLWNQSIQKISNTNMVEIKGKNVNLIKYKSNFWRTKYKLIKNELETIKAELQQLSDETETNEKKLISKLQLENSAFRSEISELKLIDRTFKPSKIISSNLQDTVVDLKEIMAKLLQKFVGHPNGEHNSASTIMTTALLIGQTGLKKQIECLTKYKTKLEHDLYDVENKIPSHVDDNNSCPTGLKDKLVYFQELCEVKEIEVKRLRKLLDVHDSLICVTTPAGSKKVDLKCKENSVELLENNEEIIRDLKVSLIERIKDFDDQRKSLLSDYHNKELGYLNEISELKRHMESFEIVNEENTNLKDKLEELMHNLNEKNLEIQNLKQKILVENMDNSRKVNELEQLVRDQEKVLCQNDFYKANKLEEENIKLNKRIQSLDKALVIAQARLVRTRSYQLKNGQEMVALKNSLRMRENTIIKLNAIIKRYRNGTADQNVYKTSATKINNFNKETSNLYSKTNSFQKPSYKLPRIKAEPESNNHDLGLEGINSLADNLNNTLEIENNRRLLKDDFLEETVSSLRVSDDKDVELKNLKLRCIEDIMKKILSDNSQKPHDDTIQKLTSDNLCGIPKDAKQLRRMIFVLRKYLNTFAKTLMEKENILQNGPENVKVQLIDRNHLSPNKSKPDIVDNYTQTLDLFAADMKPFDEEYNFKTFEELPTKDNINSGKLKSQSLQNVSEGVQLSPNKYNEAHTNIKVLQELIANLETQKYLQDAELNELRDQIIQLKLDGKDEFMAKPKHIIATSSYLVKDFNSDHNLSINIEENDEYCILSVKETYSPTQKQNIQDPCDRPIKSRYALATAKPNISSTQKLGDKFGSPSLNIQEMSEIILGYENLIQMLEREIKTKSEIICRAKCVLKQTLEREKENQKNVK